MRRLVDGGFSVRVREGGPLLVRSARDPALRLELDERALSEHELFVELPAPDPVLEAVWARFGDGLADPRWTDAELALLDELRATASEKKRFEGLLDTALVPESALAIARRLERYLAEGDRVLATGGQSLAGVALKRRGFDVTCLDDGPGAALLPALADELRGAFALVLVDTLPYEGLEVGALSRAHAAVAEGGHVVAFGHPMQRPLMRERFAAAHLVVTEPLFEIAARAHAGYSLDPYLWDEWILEPGGEVLVGPAVPLEEARGLDPTARVQGCLDVVGFAPGALTPEGMDRAVSLLVEAGVARPLERLAADEGGALRRYLLLEGGGHLVLAADPAEGEVVIDLSPWSPAVLFASAAAVRLGHEVAPL